jgi:hypothetical protein
MIEPKPIFMHYGNGRVTIGATAMPELGKRPSLVIGSGMSSRKVASFSSVAAAREFTEALADLCGLREATDE